MKPVIKVLIVDDESKSRYALRRLFAIIEGEKVYRVFEASDGSGALETLTRESIDAVLLDVQMPGGSGLEWLPRLVESHPSVAVIMVTGMNDVQKAVNAMKNGAADYVIKGAISPWAMGQIVVNAIEKVTLRIEIQRQKEKLLVVERHRAMTESIVSVCRRFVDPMTVITGYLGLMRNEVEEAREVEMLDESLKAANQVNTLLSVFQKICSPTSAEMRDTVAI